ncbi:hypothetical protein CN918_27590 [Priestia megaterium]|nr:hypothetical protein CN918_27590 [Priestia megaterium]
MFWVELAIYLFIITSLIYFSEYFLWIIFALFTYRVWLQLLPYHTFIKIIPFEKMSHYYIAIIVLALITYFLIMFFTQSLPLIKYVFLLIMAVYTLRTYSISDVVLFRDYFEASGMWNMDYWKEQVKTMFDVSKNPDGILGIFKKVGDAVLNVFTSFANYIKGL